MSRQREWQIRQKELGLCVKCPLKAVRAGMCADHYADHKQWAREYYRAKNGIKPRIKKQKRGPKKKSKLVLDGA